MSTFLSARIDSETNIKLMAIAHQENKTKSDIIKDALNQFLQKKQVKLAKQMNILHKINN